MDSYNFDNTNAEQVNSAIPTQNNVTNSENLVSSNAGDDFWSKGHSGKTDSGGDKNTDGHWDWRHSQPEGLDGLLGYDRNADEARYQKYLTDTEVARRLNDAKRAGVNPYYALLGNSAGAGVDSSALKSKHKKGDPISQMKEDHDKKKAQEDKMSLLALSFLLKMLL